VHEIEGSLHLPKQITVIFKISISTLTHSYFASFQKSALTPISIDPIALLSIAYLPQWNDGCTIHSSTEGNLSNGNGHGDVWMEL